MSFSEICIYRVKAEESETLMAEVMEFMKRQKGVSLLRFMKRGNYWKERDEFRITPHDKHLGEIMF